jgi:hypothetical protein
MAQEMSMDELYELVLEFFGYKVNPISLNDKNQEIECILYDSLAFRCGFDDQYGSFDGVIYVGPKQTVSEPLAHSLFTDSNEESIRKKLQIVDDYCRLRLPDKFLEAYDRAYKNKE